MSLAGATSRAVLLFKVMYYRRVGRPRGERFLNADAALACTVSGDYEQPENFTTPLEQ